jgi:hypothetical protein
VRHVQVEYVRLRYRLEAPTSNIDVAFRGVSDPSCEVLDSCGAAGRLTLSLGPADADFTLTASRVVKRQISASRALSDFVHGRLRLGGGEPVPMPGDLTETLNWGDNTTCGDSRRVSDLAVLLGSFAYPSSASRSAPISVLTEAGVGFDPLRTDCPGPSDADIFGAQPLGSPPTLAQGSVNRHRLVARRSSIVLSPAGSFSGLGYTGTRGGAVRLDLTLLTLSAGTRVEIPR